MVSALFAAGIMTGVIIDRILTGMEKKPTLTEKREGGYRFINPLLECDGGQDIIGDQEVRPFQHTIEAYVDGVLEEKRASQVSVYFRDLTNGPSFGVNEDERFAPASLLKVPLMIAYYKMAEFRPALLKERLLYDGKLDTNRIENFKAPKALKPGKRYTIEELIEMMIAYSDNNAMHLLFNHMDQEYRKKVYQDLGIVDSETEGDVMSVEEYTSCFRVLFNSSYLNRELSERALRYLAEPDFPYGIMGGVPPGVIVAQKYGERAYEGTNVKELHDCGIVYYPNSPYLLCVMTSGSDFDFLSETIRGISAMVFTEVDRNQIALQAKGAGKNND
jgi:beta-lactamase class A